MGSLSERLQVELLAEIHTLLQQADPVTTQFMLMPLGEAYARQTNWLGDGSPDWSYHCQQTSTLIL